MQSAIEVIINAGSGADSDCEKIKAELVELFKTHNLEAHISIAEKGEDLPKLAGKAAAGKAEIIVAGGGDGTISAVASEIIGTKKTLGVLPLGTLNHFSKDLNIPQNLAEAVRVIAENHTQEIDAGSVNEYIFINNSSIGLYPSIVRERERGQSLGKSKWSAAFWATLKIFKRSPFLKVKIKIEGEEILRKTPFIFVGNNEYEMDFFNIGTRAKLDDGKLSVYFLHRPGRFGLLRLAFRTIFGRLKQMKDFEAINTEEVTIETRKKNLLVAFDGEVQVLQTPLCYKIQPKALRVIVPSNSE
jgi:YegS/Rv2252/BmrU family lipid kinase